MINTAGIPYELTDSAKAMYEALQTLPKEEIVESCKTATDLANVASENASKFLPSIFSNDIVVADQVARVGKGVLDCVKEIARLDAKTGAAIVISCAGIGVGLYALHKVRNVERNTVENLNKMNASIEELVKALRGES